MINSVIKSTNTLFKIEEPFFSIIMRAFDWHANGNKHSNSLNRFINYWASIELLGHFFYKNLDRRKTGRLTRSQKRNKISNLLRHFDVDKPNSQLIKDCYAVIEPSIRTKLLSFLDSITDRNDFEQKLFHPDEATKKSLYDIRNDIAHGTISDHHFEEIGSYRKRLYDAARISRDIISVTVTNLDVLRDLIHG